MRCKRTVRRPTRWTPDEWRQVETAADARNVPPARFVREAVLNAQVLNRISGHSDSATRERIYQDP